MPAAVVQTVLPYNEANENWEQDLYPVPSFRRRNGNVKNPDGQGLESGDFFAPFAKKYCASLDGLDSWSVYNDLGYINNDKR
jgi:hypothetical protein